MDKIDDSNTGICDDLYASLGVSAAKNSVHEALECITSHIKMNTFASLSSDIAGDDSYYSFIHADGAGTKSIVNYLLYRASDGADSCAEFFASLADDALAMNIDDVYCLGQVQSLVLSNTIARNSRLIPDAAVKVLINRYQVLCNKLAGLGIAIQMGGGETADCPDLVRTLQVDATVAGRIYKDNVIDASSIEAGDVVVGFSSTGKATYETMANSGIASNGLTLARHVLLSRGKMDCLADVADSCTNSDRSSYFGPYCVTDSHPALPYSIGEALACPTRIYAPILARIYGKLSRNVHGAIHCTGGGQAKVIRFLRNKRVVKDSLFAVPPLFELIQKTGNVSWREMYNVFNMGHLLELYLPRDCVEMAVGLAEEFGIEAKIVGCVEDSEINEVVVMHQDEAIVYTL